MFSIFLMGLALFLALLHGIYLTLKKKSFQWEALILMYLLFCNIGLMGFLNFYAHTVLGKQTAELIGWPPSNPFQLEVAVANLAFGILGLLSVWIRTLSFWFATLIGASIYLFGALIIHLIEYARGNSAIYNIGPSIWMMDLFVPVVLISLFLFLFQKREKLD